jgi:hypothetical protein
MSFDLYVIHMKDGEPAQADRQPVLDVFDRCGTVERHGGGFYDAFFDDGSHVQFSASGLETDEDFNICVFHLRNFTFPIMRFVYEVAVAGDMMIANGQGHGTEESPSTIIVNEGQRQHLWSDAGVVRLVTSPVELAQALVGDVSAWQGYRDQVVAGSQGSAE